MKESQVQELVKRYSFNLVETHISWVLIGEDVVYKIKKPVDFGFLDYTTLKKRQFYCNKEIELNRRLAREIYLGVSKITKDSESFTIDGDGKVVDYAVRMNRMPQDRMMDVLIENNQMKDSYIVALAKKIADFHLRAETNDYISQFGNIETNKFNTDENFEQTKDGVGEFITQFQYDAIKDYTNNSYIENKGLFEKRVREQKIRDCHGDLYSRNICIVDEEEIYVYDCIEFNERFRYSDVASDVAFLLMDLENYSRYELSDLFFKKYIEFSKDVDLERIVDFYKVYRAYVRGKIAFFQRNKEEAGRYFDLAFGYLPCEYKPKVVVLGGLTGSGKTTVAKALKERADFVVISSDEVRKQLVGMDVYDKDLSDYKKGIYSEEMTQRAYDEIVNQAYGFVKNGKSVILDATFIKKWQRNKVFERLKRLGIKPLVVFLEVDEELALEHFKKREKEKSISDGRYEIFVKQKNDLEMPKGAIVIDAKKPIDEIAEEILSRVGVQI